MGLGSQVGSSGELGSNDFDFSARGTIGGLFGFNILSFVVCLLCLPDSGKTLCYYLIQVTCHDLIGITVPHLGNRSVDYLIRVTFHSHKSYLSTHSGIDLFLQTVLMR